MALVLKDRVKQTASNPGTGTLTLGTTPAGFQAFSVIGNGNTTYFTIVDPVSGDWEVNYGTYTSSGTTLSRNATPLSSSNGGTLVNFTGTALDVFCTYPSENAVWRDTSGTVVQQSFGAITATSAALTSGTITTAPSNATDIVNKEYADSISSGLNYHQPVNYASTAALPTYTYNNGTGGVGATITANANGALSLGGGSPTATQRVLVKDEVSANAPYNGVYVVTQAGSAGTPFILTRATDYDTSGSGTNEIDQGDYVLVISGTLASTAWVQQTALPITVGTTALTFLQFNAPITYSAGTGLTLSPATTFNISNTGVTASTYGSASAVPVFAVNAQGQITSVTNTNIAINGSAVSGNISGSAGSVANALTAGTYLTSTGTFDGSVARTFAVDAVSTNTASKVVARDSSGNFSAGTITATLSGSATSATTATNIAGGGANQIPYQTGLATTSFVTAPTTGSTFLNWTGAAFAWSAISTPNSVTFNNGGAGDASGTTFNGSAARTISYNTIGAAGTAASNTFTASQVITDNSSSDALRITQTGSGNALLVEDSANPDSTPFVIDALGKINIGSLAQYAMTPATPYTQWNNVDNQYASIGLTSWQAGTNTQSKFIFGRGDSSTVGDFSNAVDSGDNLGSFHWNGSDGTAFIEAASINAAVDGTPGTNDMPGRLVFSTTADGASSPTERMRIDSAGQIIQGTPTGATNGSLQLRRNITGGTGAYSIGVSTTIQPDVTGQGTGYNTFINTAASAFTLGLLKYFNAQQGTIGAGSAVTSQYGYFVDSSLTGATNNYGFYGNIASGTGRYNLYMAGTADNYLAGNLGIGAITTGATLTVRKNITGSTTAYGILQYSTVSSDVTSGANIVQTFPSTAASAFTLTNLRHFYANQDTIGAGSTVNNQFGFHAESSLTGATNNYGFYGNIASGTGRWNLYMSGTAANHLAGSTAVGTTVTDNARFTVGMATASGTTDKLQKWDWNGGPTSWGMTLGQVHTGTSIDYAFQLQNNSSTPVTRMYLSASGTISLGASPGAESLRVTPVASAVNRFTVLGGTTGNAPVLYAEGSDTNIPVTFQTKGTGSFYIYGNGAYFYNNSSAPQFAIVATASAVNYAQVTGSATGNGVTLSAAGSDTNVQVNILAKGASGVSIGSYNGKSGLYVSAPSAGVNYGQIDGANTGNAVAFSAQGSDTDISINITPKGAGALRLTGSTSGYVGLKAAAAAGSTTYTLPSADGTSGQFLSTNGSGTLSFASQAYPGAGIPNSTGTAWGTSYTTTGSGTVVALATSPSFTTPVLGTPTSGNLTNCTADGTNKVGYLNMPQNAQTGSYTLVLADAGKHIYHASGAGAATYTIPANASVAYDIGTAVSFINLSSTAISIAITSDTMYLSSAGTTGTRTLAQYGTATAVKVTSTVWIITGSGLT